MPKIKAVRKSQKIGAMELVEKAGLDLNQPLMSACESGKVLFTPNDLQAVCAALECTPMDLFESTDEFDLMAIQRNLGAPVKVVEENPKKSKPFCAENEWKFSGLPKSNPKRSFRMSEKEWRDLRYILYVWGYNSIGQYLRKTVLDVYHNKEA